MLNKTVEQHLEKYHNSKITDTIYNVENLSVVIHFENGEKTFLSCTAIEKIRFWNLSYEQFLDFYEAHFKKVNSIEVAQ